MKLTWKDLPTEILHRIYGFVHNESETDLGSIFCCALVCKAWEIPARYALYKTATIYTTANLECLLDTVENNQELARLVKKLDLELDLDSDVTEYPDIERLFAHLPNLEIVSSYFVRPYYFPFLLNVLRNHKLPRLKRIPSPFFGCPLADAAACILLLKDRLEELELDMGKSNYEYDPFYGETIDGLYNKLHLFKNLNELCINQKEFDCEIGLMEDITTRCKSLTKLTVNLADIDELSEPRPRTITCVTGFTPQPNIKYLYNDGPILDLTLYMSYIIHKFPELKTLNLVVDVIDKWKGLSDPTVISKVMDYLSNIKNIRWGSKLTFHSNSIYDITESYRKSSINSKQQLEDIDLIYHSHVDFEGDGFYPEKEKYVQTRSYIHFYRLKHGELTDLDHIRFLENYGSRYRNVRIGGLKNLLSMIHDEQIKDLAQGEILIHALTHCPNLEVLAIWACLLEKIDISPQDLLAEKLKLNTLRIDECTVHEDMLRQLSIKVSEIKSLSLYQNEYLFKDGDGVHQETINVLAAMEFTKIGELKIGIDSSHYCEFSHLYLSKVAHGQNTCYYKCKISSRIFLPCSKQDFDERIEFYGDDPCIFINFYHVEKLVITIDERHVLKFES